MPAFYSASLAEVLSASETELSGILSISYARRGFSALRTSQALAWLADILRLQQELTQLVAIQANAASWTIVLEFEIPRKEKRIDVVLLAGDTVVILELKSSLPGIDGLRQAEEYALLLHYFHRPSHRQRRPNRRPGAFGQRDNVRAAASYPSS
jgi:hypothetical protein